MHREHSPESPTENPINGAIQDFYYSFWFSQGNPDLQQELLKMVIRRYSKDTVEKLHQNSGQLHAKIMSLRLPRSHTWPVHDVEDEFRRMGEKFIWHISDHRRGRGDDEDISEVARLIIVRDDNYQDSDPERGTGRSYKTSDPNVSYFREYVLLGRPTGSEMYDAIFSDMRQVAFNHQLDYDTMSTLAQLRRDWEKNHRGQKFMPKH